MKKIYLDAPRVGATEKKYVNEAIDSGYVSSVGTFVKTFEDTLAHRLGSPYGVATQSGTAALHISLHELGIGPGDEVIVPALTFIATVNPVMYCGATPVFVDVDPKTWNIDPKEIRKNITERTKAIIPVHLYGNPCAMDEIMDIAKENDLFVVEDATEALGATYKGAHVGTFGDFGCFSFNGNKTMTTASGGMVVSAQEKRSRHIRCLVNQARDLEGDHYYSEIGFNYRMTNIQAALGLAQMESFEQFLQQKKAFNDIYRRRLSSLGSIVFQEAYPQTQPSFWLTCALFDAETDVQETQKQLELAGIQSRRIFMPVTSFPPYQRFAKAEYAVAQEIYERGLCLPSSTLNTNEDIEYVCEILKKAKVST
ncbi:MAG TPA: aminotransferase class I/II-fold pyridoxal phosphate-dependent enzyme [Candidatus Omnitrophota bacterium]|nr:aminotransferase class I/II-fold pyridoxal phosphate-dependent enzyme [Candidatus Omnitrophota bacterium]